jgi:hypothetical protein
VNIQRRVALGELGTQQPLEARKDEEVGFGRGQRLGQTRVPRCTVGKVGGGNDPSGDSGLLRPLEPPSAVPVGGDQNHLTDPQVSAQERTEVRPCARDQHDDALLQ